MEAWSTRPVCISTHQQNGALGCCFIFFLHACCSSKQFDKPTQGRLRHNALHDPRRHVCRRFRNRSKSFGPVSERVADRVRLRCPVYGRCPRQGEACPGEGRVEGETARKTAARQAFQRERVQTQHLADDRVQAASFHRRRRYSCEKRGRDVQVRLVLRRVSPLRSLQLWRDGCRAVACGTAAHDQVHEQPQWHLVPQDVRRPNGPQLPLQRPQKSYHVRSKRGRKPENSHETPLRLQRRCRHILPQQRLVHPFQGAQDHPLHDGYSEANDLVDISSL